MLAHLGICRARVKRIDIIPLASFSFASCGSGLFESKAASSLADAVSSVPDLEYSFASVFIFSLSSCASLCGFVLDSAGREADREKGRLALRREAVGSVRRGVRDR